MSKNSGWFLGAACAAILVPLARTIPGVPVGERGADFAAGIAAALMFGVLVSWKVRRVE